MTKPRLFWLAFAACLGLAGFWGVRLLTPRHRINHGSFEKIQVGMTLEEVEALVGVPPGDYASGPYHLASLCRFGWGGKQRLLVSWVGNEGQIQVLVDNEKKVCGSMWADISLLEESNIIEKLRCWMGLNEPVGSQPLSSDW